MHSTTEAFRSPCSLAKSRQAPPKFQHTPVLVNFVNLKMAMKLFLKKSISGIFLIYILLFCLICVVEIYSVFRAELLLTAIM